MALDRLPENKQEQFIHELGDILNKHFVIHKNLEDANLLLQGKKGRLDILKSEIEENKKLIDHIQNKAIKEVKRYRTISLGTNALIGLGLGAFIGSKLARKYGEFKSNKQNKK